LKQTTSVAQYIQKFEELMSLIQKDYPNLNEPYFVSSFIAGLKEGIKHYLIPRSPQTLSDTEWKAKELEKDILVKKSLLSSTYTFPKPTTAYTTTPATKTLLPFQTTPSTKTQPTALPNQQTKPTQIPLKPRELGKCWGVMNHGHRSTNSIVSSKGQ
jgi:hypothetical protein